MNINVDRTHLVTSGNLVLQKEEFESLDGEQYVSWKFKVLREDIV